MRKKRRISFILLVALTVISLFGCGRGNVIKKERVNIVPETLQCATAEDESYVCCIIEDGEVKEPLFSTSCEYALQSKIEDANPTCVFSFTKLYDDEKMGIEWFHQRRRAGSPDFLSRGRNARFRGVFSFQSSVIRQNIIILVKKARFVYAANSYSKTSNISESF